MEKADENSINKKWVDSHNEIEKEEDNKYEKPYYKEKAVQPENKMAPHLKYLSTLKDLNPIDLCLLGCRMCFKDVC